MPRSIGIVGYAGAGKDAFASLLARYLRKHGHSVTVTRFAAHLKNISYLLGFGSLEDRALKEKTVRRPMCGIGREIYLAVRFTFPDMGEKEVGIRANNILAKLVENKYTIDGDSNFIECSKRQLEQAIGAACRDGDPDFWVRQAAAAQQGIASDFVIYADVRYENEAKSCGELVGITRPGVGPINEHDSEKHIPYIIREFCETEIDNIGDLRDLEETAGVYARAVLGVGT